MAKLDTAPAVPCAADVFSDALLRRSCHDRFRAHRIASADNSQNIFRLTLPRFSHSIYPNNSIINAQNPWKTVSTTLCSNDTSRNFHAKYPYALRTRNFVQPLYCKHEN